MIKPLPAEYRNIEDVTEVLAAFGTLQAAVEDVREHVSRYHIVGRDVWLELWDADTALSVLSKLNDREKERATKLLKGKEVGEEFELDDEQGRLLSSLGTLVRDAMRTSYNRKLDHKLATSAASQGPIASSAPNFRVGEKPLKQHERWVYDLMEAAGLTFRGYMGYRDSWGHTGGKRRTRRTRCFGRLSSTCPTRLTLRPTSSVFSEASRPLTS